ncbi:ParB/RepB/Spo0J family partition protein [Anaeromyxobacter dehalogenans]|uniref:Chromosome segregation DNA-binding protein n=1 Tax=Anaeromyxobacter dehalogenans (strain 2CP-C) TaxID=290397 RepID=Q2IHQ5_ANADE|nr:ParB/RepB/Spo0J family partition protein [Anaeromyxobacter dehalogenans]ABC84117.1 chromosome segregation DNA-binding protein [Anaeromyxobacter dehalogenans 2CP-C]
MSIAEKRRPALGRGMAALLSNAPPPPSAVAAPAPAVPGRTLLTLPVEAIERNPEQPRKRFEDAKLEELAASIRQHGIVEPILVRKDGARYRILAGERRWRAAQRAGLKEVPAVLREATDREAFELALVENLQRADLNAIEEAEAYEVLQSDHGLTQEAIATRVGKERSTVANALRLLKLPEDVRESVRGGQLDMGHARALLGLEDAEAIRKIAQRAIREGLSVRATEALVRSLSKKPSKAGPADPPADSPAIRDLAHRLQRRLGARCRVVPKSAVAGKLEVEYTSLDELDGILAKIGA